MAKFSGHAVTFRSAPTVLADTRMPGSARTRILSGKPPRAIWRAAILLGLYFILGFLTRLYVTTFGSGIFLPEIMALAAVVVAVVVEAVVV
jgi:hypothetical protein